jgi:hypothetical protein
MKSKNYLLRVKKIQELARLYYEPERRDKCYKWVWKNKVYPIYPCGYRTFLRAMKSELPPPTNSPMQTDLFRYL